MPKAAAGGQPVEATEEDRLEFGAAVGAGASRLIFGTAREHLVVEELTAEWLGCEESLLFSSGYAANIGALGALLSPGDAVFSDALNHASLIDGIRLSRAQPTIFPHLDLKKLAQGLHAAAGRPARWVIVESYYSMDGDGPDLLRLRELCDRYDAHLYCDEAHSIGAFGPEGRGLCAQAGIRPDVLMAGFGKAVGAQGACVLGSAPLRTWLWNRARSFVFSTAPSPLLAHTLAGQIQRTRGSDDARAALADAAHYVRTALMEAGIQLPPQSFGPVISIVVGTERDALHLAERLQERGILAQAVRPPTVPEGQSRIRLVLRSSFRNEQCSRLAQIVARETKSLLGSGR